MNACSEKNEFKGQCQGVIGVDWIHSGAINTSLAITQRVICSKCISHYSLELALWKNMNNAPVTKAAQLW